MCLFDLCAFDFPDNFNKTLGNCTFHLIYFKIYELIFNCLDIDIHRIKTVQRKVLRSWGKPHEKDAGLCINGKIIGIPFVIIQDCYGVSTIEKMATQKVPS